MSGPHAWVSVYPIGRYVDENHIVVTTTIGDLAGSHRAAFDALRKAGITPARTSPGAIKLTVSRNLPLATAEQIVIAALKAGGLKVDRHR